MLGGYPRSAFDVDSAAITLSSGGSHGVPIDRSTTPPSSAAASGAKPIEPIVRIRRRNEAGGFSHEGTILPDGQ